MLLRGIYYNVWKINLQMELMKNEQKIHSSRQVNNLDST